MYITANLTKILLSSGLGLLVLQRVKMLRNLICPDRVRQPSTTFPKPCCARCSEARTLHRELWASFNCTLHFHFPLKSWFGELLSLFWKLETTQMSSIGDWFNKMCYNQTMEDLLPIKEWVRLFCTVVRGGGEGLRYIIKF